MKSFKLNRRSKARDSENNDVTVELKSTQRRGSNQADCDVKFTISPKDQRRRKLKQLSLTSPLPSPLKMTSPVRESSVTSFASRNSLKSMTSYDSTSSFNDSFASFSLNGSVTSLSMRDSSPALSVSMTSNDLKSALAKAEMTKSKNKPEVSKPNNKTVIPTKKKSNIFKFPFRKSKTSQSPQPSQSKRRSSAADIMDGGRSREVRSQSLNINQDQLLEEIMRDNQTLKLEVRGKEEEVRMLNASIDQSNQTWEAKVMKLQRDVEHGKKRCEELIKQVNQHHINTKQPVRVPVASVTSPGSPKISTVTSSELTSEMTPPRKRHGVRESPSRRGIVATSFQKTPEVMKRLRHALMSSKCLSQLPEGDVTKLIDVMKYKKINKGERLMQEGTLGQAFYVMNDGECRIYKKSDDVTLTSSTGIPVNPWSVFGDVDVFYHSPRVWSCKCVRQGSVWFVTREEFRAVVSRQDQLSRKKETFFFLKSIPAFQKLERSRLKRIVNCSKLEHYGRGDYVIQQGSIVSFVYVIKEGEVHVSRLIDGTETLQHVLRKGQWFGDVITGKRHPNNVIAASNDTVQCVLIPIMEVADVRDLMTSSNGDVTDVDSTLAKRFLDLDGAGSDVTKSGSSGYGSEGNSPALLRKFNKRGYDVTHRKHFASVAAELSDKGLQDFHVVATIGNGAFGLVDLVTLATNPNSAFAVKKMSNQEIVSNEQQNHVTQEKEIQFVTSQECPFIASLYTSFKDKRYVYFVMEYCAGGELFKLMTSAKSFDRKAARFYAGCVIEALSYLHSGNIVYRDLKPENLVLDGKGYCKLTDFGFAKKLSKRSGLKTFTFCGTPECMAPEAILYKGHSFPVDLWSLGVFIYEIVVGKAPFRNRNKDELGQSILRGVEPKLIAAKEAKRIDDVTVAIVRELCQMRPEDRLGAGRMGIYDVTKHCWFDGFDWELLRQRKMESPWKPQLNSATDIRYFDVYNKTPASVSGEFPGWDESF
ncbi:cGMP-dependent protein kinase 1-like isoform X2 [Ciona intestinalis]